MRTKKNPHKKNARKRRTNKSVKRRRTRTLTRKRSYKYQRRGGVKVAERSEIGRFYLLGPPESSFRPLYLTVQELDPQDEGYATQIHAQSLPPVGDPPTKKYRWRGRQIDLMQKDTFTGEVEIVEMEVRDQDIILTSKGKGKGKYEITLNYTWIRDNMPVWRSIISNYDIDE
jgi:hypothetical protein